MLAASEVRGQVPRSSRDGNGTALTRGLGVYAKVSPHADQPNISTRPGTDQGPVTSPRLVISSGLGPRRRRARRRPSEDGPAPGRSRRGWVCSGATCRRRRTAGPAAAWQPRGPGGKSAARVAVPCRRSADGARGTSHGVARPADAGPRQAQAQAGRQAGRGRPPPAAGRLPPRAA